MDLIENEIYTDGHLRFRKIVKIYHLGNGTQMIKYEKGAFLPNHNWRKFYTGEEHVCTRKTFLKWVLREA